MSTDIKHLLAAAADDSDQPLHTDVDDILIHGRRSVRRSRIATIATAALTTAAVLGGVATWSSTRNDSADPAGKPAATITVDVKTGRIVDDETGKTVTPAPPVSPLSDAVILQRCKGFKETQLEFMRQHRGMTYDKAGPVDPRWKVVVKSGDQSKLSAMFLSPDQSIVQTCDTDGPGRGQSAERASTTVVRKDSTHNQPQAVEDGLRVPAADAKHVLVDLRGESSPREALLGTDGFFTIAFPNNQVRPGIARIRAYDAGGTKVFELVNKLPTIPTVPPGVAVRTAEPITPQVVLTKDPETGKPLAPPPPVSPLTDDQITTRCRGVDDIYFKDLANSPGNPNDSVIKEAGPVTKDWQVALKTGTGDKLTAVLVSPDKRVFAWCHMLTPTAKGAYDYDRGAVQTNGKFADHFEWAMVPDGVAQIVVDLPKGQTRALMSNGYYTWGLTGGNSGLKKVRVRGFDAQGKKVYDVKKDLDTDFD